MSQAQPSPKKPSAISAAADVEDPDAKPAGNVRESGRFTTAQQQAAAAIGHLAAKAKLAAQKAQDAAVEARAKTTVEEDGRQWFVRCPRNRDHIAAFLTRRFNGNRLPAPDQWFSMSKNVTQPWAHPYIPCQMCQAEDVHTPVNPTRRMVSSMSREEFQDLQNGGGKFFDRLAEQRSAEAAKNAEEFREIAARNVGAVAIAPDGALNQVRAEMGQTPVRDEATGQVSWRRPPVPRNPYLDPPVSYGKPQPTAGEGGEA